MMTYYNFIVYGWIAVAVISFPFLLKQVAPYGRHSSEKWGWMMPNKAGWMLMELVSPLALSLFFFCGTNSLSQPAILLWALWVLHYFNRSIIFPLRTKTTGKKIPVLVVLSACFFNLVNGSLNGYWLRNFGGTFSADYFSSAQFIIGFIIFLAGAVINIKSDNMLLNLRKPGETGYKIPKGFLFEHISCPNHFGEMVQWCGFAIMGMNIAAFSFAVWTFANLAPRALHHHIWYRQQFANYPKNRKAFIPFVW